MKFILALVLITTFSSSFSLGFFAVNYQNFQILDSSLVNFLGELNGKFESQTKLAKSDFWQNNQSNSANFEPDSANFEVFGDGLNLGNKTFEGNFFGQNNIQLTSQTSQNLEILGLVWQNNNLDYRFGDRLNSGNFLLALEKQKNDLCGNSVDTNKVSYSSNISTTVLKTVSINCNPNNLEELTNLGYFNQTSNWLKLVFDNGLISWVEVGDVSANNGIILTSFNKINVNANRIKNEIKTVNITPQNTTTGITSIPPQGTTTTGMTSIPLKNTNTSTKTTTISSQNTTIHIANIPLQGTTTTGMTSIPLQGTTTTKTCKDFSYQVLDPFTLNQYPNLDLDDDGVGCETLPKNSSDLLANSFLDISSYDANGSGKVTCSDFGYQILDSAILAMFPSLDADGDGLGCEGNKVNPDSQNSTQDLAVIDASGADYLDLETLDFELNLQEKDVDLASLIPEIFLTLKSDLNYLTSVDTNSCSQNNFLNFASCLGIQSLAVFGKIGLFLFHFLSGLLQGAGTAITDFYHQLVALVSSPGQVINDFVSSVQNIINDPAILLKLLQNEY